MRIYTKLILSKAAIRQRADIRLAHGAFELPPSS